MEKNQTLIFQCPTDLAEALREKQRKGGYSSLAEILRTLIREYVSK